MSESRNILTHLQIYIFLISQKNEEMKIKKKGVMFNFTIG